MKNVCLVWDNMKLQYNPHVTSLQELVGDYYLNNEDAEGNPLPDAEWTLETEGGLIVLEGRAAIESETGVIDVDGKHETYIVRDISECSKEELEAVYAYYEGLYDYMDKEIVREMLERLGLELVSGIEVSAIERDEDDNIKSCVIKAHGGTREAELRYERGDNEIKAFFTTMMQARDAGFDYVSLRKAMEDNEALCGIVYY